MNSQLFSIPSAPVRGLNKRKATIDKLGYSITQHNDLAAFNVLFQKCYTPLCYYAQKTVGCREVAEEVVSDVFVKLWSNRGKIQVHTSWESYLYRAVKNHSVDYLRSSLHEKIIKEPINDYCESLSCDTKTYLEKQAVEDDLEKIEILIGQLPRQCQVIFRLNRLDGLKYREIATQLNISIKAVEAQVSRALKQIRQQVYA